MMGIKRKSPRTEDGCRSLLNDYRRHLIGYLRPNTADTYCMTVESYLHAIGWNMAHFTVQTAETFVGTVKGSNAANGDVASPAYRNKRISALHSFADWLVKVMGMLKANPMDDVKKSRGVQRLPEYLTEDEMNRLMAGQDTSSPEGIRTRAMLEFMYCTGCRASEVADLTTDMVDLDKSEATVIGKGNKERKVYLSESCVRWMKAYLSGPWAEWKGNAGRDGRNMDRVFTNHWFMPIDRYDVYEWVSAAGRKAMLKKRLHPHMLRHSFGTTMARHGINIVAIKDLMGHESVRTTQIYTSVTEGDKREAVHNVFNKKN